METVWRWVEEKTRQSGDNDEQVHPEVQRSIPPPACILNPGRDTKHTLALGGSRSHSASCDSGDVLEAVEWKVKKKQLKSLFPFSQVCLRLSCQVHFVARWFCYCKVRKVRTSRAEDQREKLFQKHKETQAKRRDASSAVRMWNLENEQNRQQGSRRIS